MARSNPEIGPLTAKVPVAGIRMPRGIYWLSIGYAAGLLVIAVAYVDKVSWLGWLPDPLGPIPLGVPWFGALGGVTISMRGIFRHNAAWDDSYNLRHVSRPISGAIVGIVAYLIFVVVIGATGITPKTTGTVVYDLVAFLVGYREDTFRSLVLRATDALFVQHPPKGGNEGEG
jgi:hypothetical protein